MGTFAAALAGPLVPTAAGATSISSTCVAAALAGGGGWEETCDFTVAPGTGTLTLNLVSGTGFATVECDPPILLAPPTITESTPGTYSETYFRSGTCELIAGGTGSGTASAT